MRRIIIPILAAIFATGAIVASETQDTAGRDVLFQVSTINALLVGIYDGSATIGQLKTWGDTGIGTFDALDGEMVALDGVVYRVSANGTVAEVPDEETSPFAVFTFFDRDDTFDIHQRTSMDRLKELIDSKVGTKNIFYAVRVEGKFAYARTRSVNRQTKPYPPLKVAVANQPEFEFAEVGGVIVGFRSPDYVAGINVPGYHFHFITDDRKAGGHLLDCQILEATVVIDYTDAFYMALPGNEDFYTKDISGKKEKEIEKVEGKTEEGKGGE